MQRKQIYIADSNHGTILLSDFEKKIISTKLFNRLHHISQNSTAYLTFPSNRTQRFEHSIGTMKLCGDLFYSAMCNSDIDLVKQLLSDIELIVKEKIVDNKILADVEKYRNTFGEPLFRKNNSKLKSFDEFSLDNIFYNRFIPNNIPNNHKLIYVVTFQSIRLSALLHDIGHPPFSHVTESAINNIYNSLKKKKRNELTLREIEFVDIIKEYDSVDEKFQLHEFMGRRMTEKLFSQIIFPGSSEFSDKEFDEKYFIFLVSELTKLIYSNYEKLSYLHGIISGTIDGDRLDYVSRDIQNSGIENGKLEYDRLINSSKFVEDNREGNSHIQIAFDSKTINTIEDFFLKRWYLYKNIIYHHRVAKTDKLLENSVDIIINDYLSKKDAPEVDNSNILPDNISGLWKAIKFADSNIEFFDFLIQWDDNWLITTLTKHYFKDYYDGDNNVSYMLEEFLSNKKNYYSIIKSSNDFNMFMNIIDSKIDIDDIKNEVQFKRIEEFVYKKNKYNKLNVLLMYLQHVQEYKIDYKGYVDSFISSYYDKKFDDYFIVEKKPNTGLKVDPILYTNDDILDLTEISNIRRILDLEQNNYPRFYLYIKPINNEEITNEFRKKFLEEFAYFIAEKLNEITKIKEKI